MDIVMQLVDIVLHVDKSLGLLIPVSYTHLTLPTN